MKNKLVYYLSYFGILAIVASACNTEELNLKANKDLVFNIGNDFKTSGGIDYYTDGVNEYIVMLNYIKDEIQYINIKTKETEYTIPLDSLKNKHDIQKTYSFHVQNLDSVFLLMGNSVLVLLNGSGSFKEWIITDTIENYGTMYGLVSHYLVFIPIIYRDGNIFSICAGTDIVLNNPEARKKYFKRPSEVKIDITKESYPITNRTGVFPETYLTGKGYHDNYPTRCINKAGEIVYSFGVDNQLYLYKNDKLLKEIDAKSEYFDNPKPYPDDSLQNLGFLKKYLVKEPRYKQIIYDEYRNLYYRIVAHAIEYEKDYGTVNTILDKPWSIMILDSDFQILSEIKFNPEIYYWTIIPVKEGILVGKKNTSKEEKKLIYTLFTLEHNEN